MMRRIRVSVRASRVPVDNRPKLNVTIHVEDNRKLSALFAVLIQIDRRASVNNGSKIKRKIKNTKDGSLQSYYAKATKDEGGLLLFLFDHALSLVQYFYTLSCMKIYDRHRSIIAF